MKRTLFLSSLLFVFAVQVGWEDIPQTISYQGVLTDASGTAVPNGDYTLTFKLYDVDTGGTALWSEEQLVEVSKGIFNVILGSVNPLTLPFDEQYLLGVTVEGSPELTPRIELTSSPYSLNPSTGGDSPWTVSDDDIYRLGGNVGIGTTNPGEKLEVDGRIKVGFAANAASEASRGIKLHDSYIVMGLDGSSIAGLTLARVYYDDYSFRFGTYPLGQTLYGDGSNFTCQFIVKTNGNVGIGTMEPSANLDVAGTSEFNDTIFNDTMLMNDIGSTSAKIRFVSEPEMDDAFIYSENYGHNQNRLVIETTDDGDQDYIVFRNVHWSEGPKDVMNVHRDKVTINGTITAREVVVTLDGWADFVFEDNHKLTPLDELEQSIKKNKRLPGIPSAEEVSENGVNLGEMQAKFLQQLEELTLYMIEQNKKIEKLEQENEELKNRVSSLEHTNNQ